jgi:hypothetical protein
MYPMGCFGILFSKLFWKVAIPPPMTPEQIEAARYDHERRLTTPQFRELERIFGQVPDELKNLYLDSDLRLLEDVTFVDGSKEYELLCFLPADAKTVQQYRVKAKRAFPFARAGTESVYCAVIDPTQPSRCEVIKTYTDGSRDVIPVADSLAKFLALPRHERKRTLPSSSL